MTDRTYAFVVAIGVLAVTSILLLTSCASAPVAAPVVSPPADAPAPVVVQPAPKLGWPESVRATVNLQCVAAFGETFCKCLVPQLEKASPDPETQFTQEEIRTAVQACRHLAPAKDVVDL
jgi:hypothetical protein